MLFWCKKNYMKKLILFLLLFPVLTLSAETTCYHICTDTGLLYYMEVEDGEVTAATALEEGGCTNGPWVREIECGLTGPFDEDVTALLQRLDVTKLRPATQAEKDFLTKFIKNGVARVKVDSKRLPSSVLARLQKQ
jgi:hypothetical protein